MGLFPPRASIVPKLSTLLRPAEVSTFSKKIAELAPALISPWLMIELPEPIGLIASSVVSGPDAMTDAPVLMVSVELSLNSIVLSPLPYSPVFPCVSVVVCTVDPVPSVIVAKLPRLIALVSVTLIVAPLFTLTMTLFPAPGAPLGPLPIRPVCVPPAALQLTVAPEVIAGPPGEQAAIAVSGSTENASAAQRASQIGLIPATWARTSVRA